jgi:hypothetical protein
MLWDDNEWSGRFEAGILEQKLVLDGHTPTKLNKNIESGILKI